MYSVTPKHCISVPLLCRLCNELHNQAMTKACTLDSDIDLSVEKKAGNIAIPFKIFLLHQLFPPWKSDSDVYPPFLYSLVTLHF